MDGHNTALCLIIESVQTVHNADNDGPVANNDALSSGRDLFIIHNRSALFKSVSSFIFRVKTDCTNK